MAITIRKTDIAEIDQQHHQLVDLLNELIKYSGSQYDFAASITAVTGLLKYTREHFEYEEALLQQWQYPDLEQHKAVHAELSMKVQELWVSIESGNAVSQQVIELVRDWIIGHINEEDAQYAKLTTI